MEQNRNSVRSDWKVAAGMILAFFVPGIAYGHHVMEGGSLANGLTFPIHGLDHILALVAVGLWAAQQSERRGLIGIPVAFTASLLIGAILGVWRLGFPWVEQGILLSIVALGLLVATPFRAPLRVSIPLVGLLALFHGYAGGAELPAANNAWPYVIGFLLCTAGLQAVGVVAGRLLQQRLSPVAVRYLGAGIVGGGLALLTLQMWVTG